MLAALAAYGGPGGGVVVAACEAATHRLAIAPGSSAATPADREDRP
jgi:hypothetical protein